MGIEYTDNSKAWFAKLDKVVDLAVEKAGDVLAQGIQDGMPGSGASKTGEGKNAVYTPSAPGSPPGIRTNRLKGAITSQKNGKKHQRSVGTNVEYAKIQEFGGTFTHPGGTAYKIVGPGKAVFVKNSEATSDMKRTKPHTVTLPPRPFMKPGLDSSKKTMTREFIRVLKRGMK